MEHAVDGHLPDDDLDWKGAELKGDVAHGLADLLRRSVAIERDGAKEVGPCHEWRFEVDGDQGNHRAAFIGTTVEPNDMVLKVLV